MESFIKIIISLVGLLVGVGFYKLAQQQIQTRCEKIPSLAEAFSPKLLDSKKSFIIWELLYVTFFALATFCTTNPIHFVFSIIVIICGMNIAAVDLAIRRIPNELLLTLMIASLVCNISECLIYKQRELKDVILSMVIGLVGAFIIYKIPQMMRIYIGNGDIKLSAVIGFAVGIVGYMQAMLIMGVFMIIYLLVLVITKKGGLKTKTPMGPALSLGAILSVIFPILANHVLNG